VYAAGSAEWWLFYDDTLDPTKLKTRYSADFVTWQDGGSMILPMQHAGDGRDLSVAYKSLGGHDVVHITQGCANHNRYHIKAVITPGSIAFGLPKLMNQGNGEDPDGSATVVLDNGQVLDSSGWLQTPPNPPIGPCGYGDVVMFESTANDTGLTSFDSMTWNTRTIWCVATIIGARQLLSKDGWAFQLFEDGETNPPTNVVFQPRDLSGTWLPFEPPAGPEVRPTVVFQPYSFDINDFVGALAASQLHVVRRSGPTGGTYEHRIYDLGTMRWADGPSMPSEVGKAGSGLFLTAYGQGLALFAIQGDAANTIRYTLWNGVAWSPWATLVGAPATRYYIAGYAPPGGAPPGGA
jgi:hypothetical protein